MTREQFRERFNNRFYDPAFDAERGAIARLEVIAWDALQQGRKAPLTQPAGAGFADPAYETSVQWLDTHHPPEGCRRTLGRARHTVAAAAGLRQRAQRRHLPRRDLQDLAPDPSWRASSASWPACRPTFWTSAW